VREAKSALTSIQNAAATSIASAEGVVRQVKGAYQGTIDRAANLGNSFVSQAQGWENQARAAVEDTAIPLARAAAETAYNSAVDGVTDAYNGLMDVVASAKALYDAAASTLSAVAGDVLKWINAMAKDPSQLFSIHSAHFHNSWEDFVRAGMIGFDLAATVFGQRFSINVDIELGQYLNNFAEKMKEVRLRKQAKGSADAERSLDCRCDRFAESSSLGCLSLVCCTC